jgi:hypothetical protein
VTFFFLQYLLRLNNSRAGALCKHSAPWYYNSPLDCFHPGRHHGIHDAVLQYQRKAPTP